MTVVYVDVLLILNFMINFVLLRLAAVFASRTVKTGRLILAATLGAFSSLVIFLPFHTLTVMGAAKLLVAMAMTFASFEFKSWQMFLKDVFCVFAVSFIFSGLMLALYLLVMPQKMALGNGVVYFDISATALLAATAICYVATGFVSSVLKRRAPQSATCELVICNNGAIVSVPALIDTGSSLIEPFSKAPVAVCVLKDIEKVVPQGIKDLRQGEYAHDTSFRMIPFTTVNSSGVIPAFKAQKVQIKRGNEVSSVANCFIAVTEKPFFASYSAIVNPEMLENEMVGV